MKQPISYYGGKQRMVDILLTKIPTHKTYVEPFAGGASLFWAKVPGKIEVLNDINRNLCIFYGEIKNNFENLEMMIQSTLHCEATYKLAKKIYRSKKGYSAVKRAWAVWVGAQMSFGSSIFDGNFKFNSNFVDNSHPGAVLRNKRNEFLRCFANRLENVQILNKDALKIITKFDREDTFIYIDPPYFNAHQGHYQGYSLGDFKNLLDILEKSKSKFLLSSYDSDLLREYAERNHWNMESYTKRCSINVNRLKQNKKDKVEVITYNYNSFQQMLF